jgi:hypothetical protein
MIILTVNVPERLWLADDENIICSCKYLKLRKDMWHLMNLQVAKFRYATQIGNSSLQTAVPKTPGNMKKDYLPQHILFRVNSYNGDCCCSPLLNENKVILECFFFYKPYSRWNLTIEVSGSIKKFLWGSIGKY